MINKNDLVYLQENGFDVIGFIDSYLENKIANENDPERYELLVKVYSEGWGETIGKMAGNVVQGAKNFGQGLAKGYQGAVAASDNASKGFFGDLAKGFSGTSGENPEKVAEKALQMLKNAGLMNDSDLQKMMQYFTHQISMRNMNMGDRMAGKHNQPAPHVQFGTPGTPATPPPTTPPGTPPTKKPGDWSGWDGKSPMNSSYNPELNFYNFSRILESK